MHLILLLFRKEYIYWNIIEIDYDSYQGRFERVGGSEEDNKVGNY